MVSLLQKINNKKRDRGSKNKMAKKSKSKKKSKSNRAKGFGSGLRRNVEKIPILGDIIKNPTIRKATAATGTVALIASLAALIPNQSVQNAVRNPTIRAGAAFVLGDVPGGALQLIQDRNIISNFQQNGNGGNGMNPMNGSV